MQSVESILARAYDRWDRRYHMMQNALSPDAYREARVLLEQADRLVQRLTEIVYGPE